MSASAVPLLRRIVVGLAFAATALGAVPADAARRGPTSWMLPNGLKVLFVANHEAPLASVTVLYHVGSRDEQPGERGAARVIEAMMARGSEHVAPGAHESLLRQMGGGADSLTKTDVTTFVDTAPAAQLPFVLALEADRMRGLVFSADGFAAARAIAAAERRTRVDGNPVARAREVVRTAALGPSAAATPLASEDELGALTLEACKRFYDRTYVPARALMVIVADAAEDRVRSAVSAAFGRLPRGERVAPAPPAAAPNLNGEVRVLPGAGPAALVMTAFRVPGAAHADRAALETLVTSLAVGRGSRLGMRLVRDDGPVASVGGVLELEGGQGLLVVFALLRDGAEAAAVRGAIDEELEALRARGLAPEELTHVRLELAARAARALETGAALSTQLAIAEASQGGAARALALPDRFSALRPADVARAANAHLVASHRITVQLGGAGAAPGAPR